MSSLDKWDEVAIKNRAEHLAAMATGVWAVPSLEAEVLESYRPRREKTAGYTIDDHPLLVIGSPMHELFEIFRKGHSGAQPVRLGGVSEALCRLQG